MLKKNIVSNIVIMLTLILATLVCVICFKYQLLTAGLIIVISFSIMSFCIGLLKIQRIKVDIEKEITQRGLKLKQYRCDCESYHDDNSVDEYYGGYLVFYENGFTYEYSNREEVAYIDYTEISNIDVSDGHIIMKIVSSSDVIRLSFSSNNELRIKTILKYLQEQAMHLDLSLFNIFENKES